MFASYKREIIKLKPTNQIMYLVKVLKHVRIHKYINMYIHTYIINNTSHHEIFSFVCFLTSFHIFNYFSGHGSLLRVFKCFNEKLFSFLISVVFFLMINVLFS